MALPNKVKKLLSQAEQLSDYRDCSSYFYKWLQNEFSKQPVSNLINARAEFIDRLLIKLFHDYDLAHESDLALIAVGGYGRGELHPYSDIDFMLLVSEQPSEAVCEKIGQFVTMLWDLNLEIGHSVRTIEQALEQKREDVTFATSLLESRLIFGNHIEFEKLKNHLIDTPIWRSDEFFLAKVQEQSLRHKKCHGTAYNLEPNIKENPGGLRDLQTIIWVAKKHFRAETLQELINHGYLTHEEYQELSECLENLWNIRFALHIAAGRSENRLLFDHQPNAAEILGFGSDGKASVERMMKRLFRIMSRVRELNQMLLSYFEQSILPGAGELPVIELDRNFERIGHQIRVKNPSVFFRRDQLFVLFEHIADNPEITHIYPSTIRTMRQVRRRLLGDLQDYAACREAFLRLIKHPNGMGRAFTLMHKHGIIAAYLPQWRNIFGQMQFDLFHAYTVDEHTHKLINNIYKYFDKSKVSEFPLCSEIVTRMDKPELLYLAGIFHDIAKGRGGDHSELGSVDAIAFAKLHRFPASDGKLISWLVANHLLMSVTAQRKDINDPDVIKDFASKVKNERQLDYLYCLTLADIRATNDNLWNDWKNTLLRELYLHTQRALRLGLENPMDQRDQIRDKKQQAKQRLLNHGCNEDQIDLIWSRFKANYFTAFSEQQISWHTEHLLSCEDLSQPSVAVSNTAMHGGTQVFAYSPYSGGLFARLVSVIGSKKAQIQHAQVLTTKDGYVLFSFVILEVNGDPIASNRSQGIKRALDLAISDPKKKIRLKKNRSQRFKDFNIKPKIVLRPHARKDRSLIEIQAVDIPGLLTKIAEVFQAHLLHIHAARITTVGERAEDFFVVSNNEYQALTDEEQAKIHQALRKKLNAETE
ncbi:MULTISPECIES: [protein-PII] uridylyltransferase [Pseudoalteromonas]|uniref:[protein-PII] uridylyltransferase n=1 Tax=Pseudoalteromonas TaxID=53246 RepID=UPI0006C9E9F0|nr:MULTISPECIES: [protein-PII] uridylyltransferase [Pseudoalteromonas]KPM77837.1 protein-PII uridylyltransferase [Pseudoalteromonas sp. UCD-33C]KPV98153.1 Bifunctional uridylyltransferase/uridylyl-removing enzyme [Pseudoalteromonas sp. P1-8]MDK9684408.1 [protein-PII] uridylyltransferase [Pseudoalteromonas shioyasakiensis]URQ87417.1 [protein-PII] uridylyltransferase [Pseudoalteromonas sp. SCSIO 43088]